MTRIVTAALALAFALPALAQTKNPKDQPVVYKQQTIINVTDDDVVEGEFFRPDGTIIEGQGGPMRHTSLVQARVNFLPEMLKSAERF